TASRVLRATEATLRGWNWLMASMRLEIVEGLAAGAAAIERLACGGAELADEAGAQRAALWACHRRVIAARKPGDINGPLDRWRNAVIAKSILAALAHPVRGPGRRKRLLNPDLRHAVFL